MDASSSKHPCMQSKLNKRVNQPQAGAVGKRCDAWRQRHEGRKRWPHVRPPSLLRTPSLSAGVLRTLSLSAGVLVHARPLERWCSLAQQGCVRAPHACTPSEFVIPGGMLAAAACRHACSSMLASRCAMLHRRLTVAAPMYCASRCSTNLLCLALQRDSTMAAAAHACTAAMDAD